MDYFNLKIWQEIVKDGDLEFSLLNNGAKIAILLPDTDNLLILEKEESQINSKVDNRDSFDFPFHK